MQKPHARFLYGCWWVFNSRKDAYAINGRGWHGRTVEEAYVSWRNFNRMKP
jgi:hypothetical protein